MANLDVPYLRSMEPKVVALGSHPGIIQSMLDFDFLAGRSEPSVKAIIANGRRSERYFFGANEVVIPVYHSADAIPVATRSNINLFANFNSGRRVLATTQGCIAALPGLVGGTVFAERVPEQHALELLELCQQKNIWISGGASVGVIVPGQFKLGAIGGVDARQLELSNVLIGGQIAVVSTSGGMVNEIIRAVANSGFGVSFAVALGGERFPILSPEEVLLAAEADPATKAIAYFGELGGDDEYRIVDLVKAKKLTKPVYAYVAGSVAELFETPPQFGHAKTLAKNEEEGARAKTEALQKVGVHAARTFGDFIAGINKQPLEKLDIAEVQAAMLAGRQRKLFASSVSYDVAGDVQILGQDLLGFVETRSFANIVGSMFLGRPLQSKETEEFLDFVLRLLVDHGPYVSGAVNTMVAARAGKDLVSSLAAGLLTIGPRFGGAINEAAAIWLSGVMTNTSASALVEDFAANKRYISGIGHKKYRSDQPDPRVTAILGFTKSLRQTECTQFARAVEQETLQKKGNLILNVDGAIAAVLLDMLHENEGYSYEDLAVLAEQGFFNSLFVLSRSVGFIAHYFDQVRLDEGLFRLGESHVTKL